MSIPPFHPFFIVVIIFFAPSFRSSMVSLL
jgi:hypothetical protein